MSSDESSDDENFAGFEPEEARDAENNFIAMLRQQGIGHDDFSDVSEVESNADEPEVELGPGGAADDQDEWHAGFVYFERGLPHLFMPRGNTGPTRHLAGDKGSVDFLELFLDPVVISLLIDETNRYARQQIERHPAQNKLPWTEVTVPETRAFLGLCMAMGVNRKPSVKMYWSTDTYSETPLFAKTMTRHRFCQILPYLHFADNDLEPERGSPTYDPLHKIKGLVSHLNEKFVQEYVPRRRVTVDECMVPFKGKVNFKQYMRLKLQKWGVKVWVLAESDCSYVSYVDIYPGRYHHPEGALANRVARKCLEGADIQGQGYHVYMDNFYTSPDLLTSLFEEKTYACGTVRCNRRGLPKAIMQKTKPAGIVNRGDMAFRQKGPLLTVVWKDKKCVTALSTIHDESITEVSRLIKQEDGTFIRENVSCPKLIADYTSHMGGVDKADQYMQY